MGVAEVGTTVPEKTMASKNLKIKILAKKPFQITNDCLEKAVSSACQKFTSANYMKLNGSILGSKRKLEGSLEFQREKKVKMDRTAVPNCHVILRSLMKHRHGYIFNEPVDPAKLGIPDYFDIIKTPMDLGTIKLKLDQDMYNDVEEFESDVRLTFSNAMQYNPPSNFVHHAAEHLITSFNNIWKPVKAKMYTQQERLKQLRSKKIVDRTMHHVSRNCVTNVSSHMDKLPGQTRLSAPEDIKDISLGKDGKAKCSKSSEAYTVIPDSSGPPHLPQESARSLFSRPRSLHVRSEKSVTNVVRKPAATSDMKVSRAELKVVDDGVAKGSKSSEASTLTPFPDSGVKDGLHHLAQESSRTVSARPQILHLRSAKSVANVVCKNAATSDEKVSHDESKTVDARSTSAFKMSKSDPESVGCFSCLDKEPASASCVVDMTEGLQPVLDARLSPSKALRVAMLKSRFADTILKAQHKTLMQPGGRPDPMKLLLEKKSRHEEKVRIDTQIRASESALQLKAEMEVKKQRKRDREAARMELEKMERSIDLDDNFHVVRELEALIGSGPFVLQQYRIGKSAVFGNFVGGKLRSPLESLGLFIKAEFSVGDDDEVDDAFGQEGDWEGGEVGCNI